jgi:hypothetical protein
VLLTYLSPGFLSIIELANKVSIPQGSDHIPTLTENGKRFAEIREHYRRNASSETRPLSREL